jgi:hypothetical protein
MGDLFATAGSGRGDVARIDNGDFNPGAPQFFVNSINFGTDLEIDFGGGNVLTILGITSLVPGTDILV